MPATLTLKRWSEGARVEGLGLKIERLLSSSELSVGASTQALIKLITSKAQAEVTLVVPLAAGLSVDARGMDALVRSGAIASWREGKALMVSLHALAGGTTEVKLPLLANRRGTFALAPARAFVPRAAAEGWSGEGSVTIR